MKRTSGILLQQPAATGIRLQKHGSKSVVEAAFTAEFADPTADAVALFCRNIQKKQKSGGEVRLVLPPEICEDFVRRVDLDEATDRLQSDTRRWLDEEVMVDLEPVELKIKKYTRGKQAAAIISLLPRGFTTALRIKLEEENLPKVAVLSPLAAMILLYENSCAESNEAAAFLHVSPSHTHLMLIQDGVPCFFRSIHLPLQTYANLDDRYEKFRKKPQVLVLSPEVCKKLNTEYERSLRAFAVSGSRDFSPTSLVLAGSGVDVTPALDMFEKEFGKTWALPQFSLNEPRKTASVPDSIYYQLETAVALPTQIPTQPVLLQTSGRLLQLLSGKPAVAAALILFLATLAFLYIKIDSKHEDLVSEIRELQMQQQKVNGLLSERQRVYAQRTQYQAAVATLLRIKYQGLAAAEMLAAAADQRPAELLFDTFTISSDATSSSFRLDGIFAGRPATEVLQVVNAYCEKLEKKPCFDLVELQEPVLVRRTPRDSLEAEKEEIAIEADLLEPVFEVKINAQKIPIWAWRSNF